MIEVSISEDVLGSSTAVVDAGHGVSGFVGVEGAGGVPSCQEEISCVT